MTDDPVGEIACGAARRLTGEYGPEVETEVEAALYARGNAERHAYDPVSLAALIVGVAQLAWMIYSDHRKKSPEVVERILRTELRRQVDLTPDSTRITEVVVHEIVDRMTDDNP